MSTQKYEGVEFAEIPTGNILPNPRNPRPTFHLKDTDPYIVNIGDSIRTEGQHQPAQVYEIVDHYEYEDKPGVFMLLQGESRWRACQVAGVETLRCFVTKVPRSLSVEMEWLGNEEAFKRDWQPFFKLRYCVELAESLGVDVASTEVSNKTGVNITSLRIASKLFRLEPEIQAFCAEYEDLMYQQVVTGRRQRGTRMSGSKVRTWEFPVQKGALVYDIFEALRESVPQLVRKYSNSELQHLIAIKASRATIEDLGRLHGQIKQAGQSPPPGLITQLSELIENDTRDIKTTIRETGGQHAGAVDKFVKQALTLANTAGKITRNPDQIGVDLEGLQKAYNKAISMQRDLMALERVLERKINDVSKVVS